MAPAWLGAAALTVLLTASAACRTESAVYPQEEPGGTAAWQDIEAAAPAFSDRELDLFLRVYVREDMRFAERELFYEVANRVVTVRGMLEHDDDRLALERRITAVPGVRRVILTRLDVVSR